MTGASGYIGQHLLELFVKSGLNVVAMVRNPESIRQDSVVAYPYRLDGSLNAKVLEDVHVVVHLATITSDRDSKGSELELDSVKLLLKASREANVQKFVFVSSQSAKAEAPSAYGRDKWRLEQEVKRWGGIIVRPGLVYGGKNESALFGTLCKLVQKFPAVPNLIPSPNVQPVHVYDLCDALVKIICNQHAITEFNIAAPDAVKFSEFLKALGWYRFQKCLWSIPVPAVILFQIANVLKYTPLRSSFFAERINGLLSLPKMDTMDSLSALNMSLCPLEYGFTNRHGTHRQLLIEGGTLIRYVSGKRPDIWEIRRYAKMIKHLRDGRPMGIRHFFLNCPFILRLIDPKWPVIPISENVRAELAWRMKAALAIGEATPRAVSMFASFDRKQALKSLFSFCVITLVEIPLVVTAFALKVAVRLNLFKKFKATHEF